MASLILDNVLDTLNRTDKFHQEIDFTKTEWKLIDLYKELVELQSHLKLQWNVNHYNTIEAMYPKYV